MFSNSREIQGLHFFSLGATKVKINYLLSKSRISLLKGIDGAVPRRVTEMAAVAEPKRTASISGIPSARAWAKPPLKASPAPSFQLHFLPCQKQVRAD